MQQHPALIGDALRDWWPWAHYQYARVARAQLQADHPEASDALRICDLEIASRCASLAAEKYREDSKRRDAAGLASELHQAAANMQAHADEMQATFDASQPRPSVLRRDEFLYVGVQRLRKCDGSGWSHRLAFHAYVDVPGELPDMTYAASEWSRSLPVPPFFSLWLTGPWVERHADQERVFAEKHAPFLQGGIYPSVDYMITCPGCGTAPPRIGFLAFEYVSVKKNSGDIGHRCVPRLVCPSCTTSVLDVALARSRALRGDASLCRCARGGIPGSVGHRERAAAKDTAEIMKLLKLPPWRRDALDATARRCAPSLLAAVHAAQQDGGIEDELYYTQRRNTAAWLGGKVMEAPGGGGHITVPRACATCGLGFLDHVDFEGGQKASSKLHACGGCSTSAVIKELERYGATTAVEDAGSTGLKRTYYCSRECQSAGWPSHKEECKARRRKLRHLRRKNVSKE